MAWVRASTAVLQALLKPLTLEVCVVAGCCCCCCCCCCCRALDMTPFQGRLLHVLPAKRKPGEDVEEKPDKQVGSGGLSCRAVWLRGIRDAPPSWMKGACFWIGAGSRAREQGQAY